MKFIIIPFENKYKIFSNNIEKGYFTFFYYDNTLEIYLYFLDKNILLNGIVIIEELYFKELNIILNNYYKLKIDFNNSIDKNYLIYNLQYANFDYINQTTIEEKKSFINYDIIDKKQDNDKIDIEKLLVDLKRKFTNDILSLNLLDNVYYKFFNKILNIDNKNLNNFIDNLKLV